MCQQIRDSLQYTEHKHCLKNVMLFFSSFTSTTTNTVSVTPSCFTTQLNANNDPIVMCSAPTGRRKKRSPMLNTKPIVEIDGKKIDYAQFIEPLRVRQNSNWAFMQIAFCRIRDIF